MMKTHYWENLERKTENHEVFSLVLACRLLESLLPYPNSHLGDKAAAASVWNVECVFGTEAVA